MAKSSLPTTPQAPRLFGVVPRVLLRWIVVLAIVAVIFGMFWYIVGWLNRMGAPTPDQVAETAPSARDPHNSYNELHRLRRVQATLLEVHQQAQLVSDEIDLLEEDALAWREDFEELLVSDTGKKLKDDQWVVKYAWLHQEDSDRPFRAADDFRELLDKRLDAIRQALDDPKGKLTFTDEDKRALAGIVERVTAARDAYNAHRRLVDALVGTTESGSDYEPQNLKEAVEQFDWTRILGDFGHPDYVDQGSVRIDVYSPDRPRPPRDPNSDPIKELREALEREMNEPQDAGEVGRSLKLEVDFLDPDD